MSQKPISVGDKLPDVRIFIDGKERKLSEGLKNQKALIIGVPGAFTPECTNQHLPGILEKLGEIRKSVDVVACIAVNDPHVLEAWATEIGALEKDMVMIADWEGRVTKSLGMNVNLREHNLGERCRRFALLSDNSVVKWVDFDSNSYAEPVLKAIESLFGN